MPKPEHEPHGRGKRLIDQKEETRGDKHHHENHRRCGQSLFAAWPGHPRHLLPHFLDELPRICLRHDHLSQLQTTTSIAARRPHRCHRGTRIGRSGGARTPNPRFWRPVLYQLSYTPSRSSSPVAYPYLMILATTPAPTVRPPSRIAKRSPSSIAIGAISSISIEMLSPGITISVPSGKCTVPVTSVVRK